MAGLGCMTDAELHALAHSLAYEAAVAYLECMCADVSDAVTLPGQWLDISEAPEEVVRYLEARGLLDRFGPEPDWAQVRDESEATR